MKNLHVRRSSAADFGQDAPLTLLRSSYLNLGYPLGCSASELQVALSEADYTLLSESGDVVGYARIKSLAAGNCYFDLYVHPEQKASLALSELQQTILRRTDTDRFYVQVFPFEDDVLNCLADARYTLAATMKRQVFVAGEYRDIQIHEYNPGYSENA